MPTILYLNAIGDISGAERSLLGILDGLARDRWQPLVAAPEGELLREVARRGIPVLPLALEPLHRPRTLPEMWSTINALRQGTDQLAQVVAQARPDLLHVNTTPAMLYAYRLKELPIVWHVRDLVPLEPWGALLYRRAERVVAISSAVEASLQAIAGDGAKIIRAHPGVDTARFRPATDRNAVRARLGLPTGMPLIGMVAQFAPWKRHPVFLDALKALRGLRWHAVLAGADFGRDPDYVASLRTTLATSSSLAGRVTWLPWQSDPVALYTALDLCALTSENEPFGRAVTEAMACGVPVVAADEGGPREIITNGETGLLVPPEPATLAEAMRMLLADPERRARYAAAARARAVEHFSLDAESQALSDVYATICATSSL